MNKTHKLTIKTTGRTLRGTSIQIDDMKIRTVTHLELSMDVHAFHHCTITFIVGEVDIVAEQIEAVEDALPLGR
jgi:hypothetical protein